jgi:hypothetical protein
VLSSLWPTMRAPNRDYRDPVRIELIMLKTQIIYDDVRDLPNAFAFLQRASPARDGVLSVELDTSIARVPGRD